ncbi:MAG: hypothetical protein NTZ53_10630 [Cyanobacteria bacterium]|nr:hypothetical protein [Cyanobacteriota bacterium]
MAVSVNDGMATVAEANSIRPQTSGLITATISNGAIDELLMLTGTNNAYTLAVTTASVNAADLNTLDVKTTVKVNALQVGTLTGTAAARLRSTRRSMPARSIRPALWLPTSTMALHHSSS